MTLPSSQLQKYLRCVQNRGDVFRIAPVLFKCLGQKYFAFKYVTSQYCSNSILLIRNVRHEQRSSRRHESSLELHPGLSASLAPGGSRPVERTARASRDDTRRDRAPGFCSRASTWPRPPARG